MRSPEPAAGRSLTVLGARFAICRLDPDAALPEWTTRSRSFLSICRTPTELSVVADETVVPGDVSADRGYRGLRVEGPLPLDMVGVLAAIAAPLAAARVPIFPIATFDHDYLFVPGRSLADAVTALEAAGQRVAQP
jgi:hypothetical protein